MKSISRFCITAGLAFLAGLASAEERIPWVADFSTACGMAAEQRRLVLLHFYNDNCGPCVRVDQNVFSRPEVADAVAQSYIAVKVHAGKNPQLASKYRVNQWPTDVFVTASGLEVFRTVSPQKPSDYIAVLNQVATHSGVGSGRLANNPLNTIAQATAKTQAAVGAGAATLMGAFSAADQRAQQANADVHRAAAEAQQKWNATTQQAQSTVNQTQSASTSIYQQATTAIAQGEQQVAAAGQQAAATATSAVEQAEQQTQTVVQQAASTAKQWENQATGAVQQVTATAQQTVNTVQQYEQQATAAYQQARDRATQVGQQVEQQAESTKQQWQTTASQTAQDVNSTAQSLKQQASAFGSSLLDRRSAFVPAEASPAATATAPAPSATASLVSSPHVNQPTPPTSASAPPRVETGATPSSAAPPLMPQVESPQTAATAPATVTSNPFVATQAAQTSPTANAATPPASAASRLAQAYSSAAAAAVTPASAAFQAWGSPPAPQPQPAANAPTVNSPPANQEPNANSAALANHQLVPVSQAPPVGLDGFCPVTLVETMASNPGDRNAWKKGDRRFGAIHKGRTYLFTSADNQQKFLQNPDAYAPVLSGCDPVIYTERGQMIDGKRAFGLVTADKHIYLFADESSRSRFEKSPASYVGALQQAAARNTQSASIYR